MAGTRRTHSLEIDADRAHQRREWRVQRIGWALMALLLAAALAGLLGPGPASRTSTGSADGRVRVDYDRFGRVQAPARMRIGLDAAAVRTGTVYLRLGRDFVDRVGIERIHPEPGSVTAGPDEFVYQLRTVPGTGPMRVDVHYRAERPGTLPVRVAVGDARPVVFHQWIYP